MYLPQFANFHNTSSDPGPFSDKRFSKLEPEPEPESKPESGFKPEPL